MIIAVIVSFIVTFVFVLVIFTFDPRSLLTYLSDSDPNTSTLLRPAGSLLTTEPNSRRIGKCTAEKSIVESSSPRTDNMCRSNL